MRFLAKYLKRGFQALAALIRRPNGSQRRPKRPNEKRRNVYPLW